MTVTPYQPTLPPEGDFTDAEIDFMESSPPGLFPENQDSNFGYAIRKTWADRVQELIAQLDTLYSERFVETSTQFLDEWEMMAGVPTAPSGLDVATRQAIVLGRVRKGPFTRSLRRQIVENYIGATFGTPVIFDSAGVAMAGAGVPLYAASGTVKQMYEIVEDVPSFLYHLFIENTITPAAGMTRELTRITPAGISYDITYVANAAPRLYWKLNEPVGATTVVDYAPFSHPGTPGSGITFSPAAIPPYASFNNTANAKITSSYSPFVVGSKRTFMGWAWRNSTADGDTLIGGSSASLPGSVMLRISAPGTDVNFYAGTLTAAIWASAWPGTGSFVHWALTYDDSTRAAELFINGVSKGVITLSAGNGYSGSAGTFQIGTWGTSAPDAFNGNMRDVAVYERILSLAEIQSYAHGNTLP